MEKMTIHKALAELKRISKKLDPAIGQGIKIK